MQEDKQFRPMPPRIETLLEKALAENVFPGAAVSIVHGSGNSRKSWQGWYGYRAVLPEKRLMNSAVYFDLASLTKPLATTLAVYALLTSEELTLQTRVDDVLTIARRFATGAITVRQLLNHSSGMAAHRPFYRQIVRQGYRADRDEIQRLVLAEPLLSQPGKNVLYSDLGYMVLGWMVEEIATVGLNLYVQQRIYKAMGLTEQLFFIDREEKGHFDRQYAATEDCPWRQRVLLGEVHDQNAHAMGGVAGQAGLFGDLAGVTRLVVGLLDLWQGRAAHPHIETDLFNKFLRRSSEPLGTTWALGFDTPSSHGSSGGCHLSARSVGHLGYTGTSFWIDPDRDLVMILLTNRIHPSVANETIKQFRPLFHDTVIETLGLC